MNPKVDLFLKKAKKWQEESVKLREILLDCPLREELKWGQPCYTSQGKNIVLIGPFKDYVSLLFVKGALLADPHHLLVAPGAVQAGRQIRFESLGEIVKMENIVKTYVYEAIEVERAGLKVKLKEHSEYEVPEELQRKLDGDPALKAAFDALTPGRQRGYMIHVGKAKQAKTRVARVEQCVGRILEGKGLNDE